MSTPLNRRKFLQMSALGAVGLVISGRVKSTTAAIQSQAPSLAHQYFESPTLNQMTSEGIIPAVNVRLPKAPLVLIPIDGVKVYGGSIHTLTSSWAGGDMEETQYGHSPLRWIKDGLEIAPGMCDTWSTNANNTQWTVHIREGLKWSDGAQVTVDDILFWWNDLVDPNYPGGPDGIPDFGYDGAGLATFTKVDDFTLTISYTTPAPLTGYRLAMWVKGNIGPRWIAPAHYLKQFHPKYNPIYPDFTVLLEKIFFRTNPACPSLDPWVCVQYTPADETHPNLQIIWRRNPYYYAVDPDGNQLPYIDEWIEDGIDDRLTQISQVKAGQVDFLHFHSLLLTDIPNLQGGQVQGNYELRLLDSGSGTGMVYFWNYDHPDLNKRTLYRTPKFKQAMSLALNRPLIQTSVYHGYGVPTTGTMSPKAYEFNFNDEARSRYIGYRDAFVAYDPAQARTLLESINVKDINTDSWREYPDGSPLLLHVDVPDNASPECMAVLSIALQNWWAVGLNVQSNIIPANEFNWQNGQGDIHTNWEVGDGPNHLLYPSWMVPNEPERWAPLCGRTFQYRGTPWENTDCSVDPWARTPPRYCSTDIEYAGTPVAQIQQIFLQAEIEPDLLKRVQYVWQILDIHKSNVFYLGTVGNYPRIEIVNKNLHNVPTREQLALGGIINPWIIPYPAIANPETWSFAHQMFLPMTKK